MHQPDKSQFRFVISGDLEDFAAFCAIIRGDDRLDDETARRLTEKLKTSTDKLKAAEAAATSKP